MNLIDKAIILKTASRVELKILLLVALFVTLLSHDFSHASESANTSPTPTDLFLPIINTPSLPLAECDNPIPNVAFAQSELFSPASYIKTQLGRNDIATSFSIDGKLIIVQSDDDVNKNSSLEIYDISNPRRPQRLKTIKNASTDGLREAHSVSFNIRNDRHLVAMQATHGVMMWDFTDVTNPKEISSIQLNGVSDHPYNAGGFWLTWHGDVIYFSAIKLGIFVIDASNPYQLRVNKVIDPSSWGGFPAGSIQTLGNYLYLGAGDARGEGMAIFDISSPLKPSLISTTTDVVPQYSMLVNGDVAYVASKEDAVSIYDVSNPHNIHLLGEAPVSGNGGYISVQDDYAFIGATSTVAKVNITNPAQPYVVGQAYGGASSRDHDFAVPYGNLIVVGDDHNQGGILIPHQTDPDTSPPGINRIVPANNSVNQPRTTAVGISFTDQINIRTVNYDTVIVRPLGGSALPGVYTYQTNLLNFQPDEPFKSNTTYEVVIPVDGIGDLLCNRIKEPFVARFSTGSFVDEQPSCGLEQSLTASRVGEPVTFSGELLSGYAHNTVWGWDFGDGQQAGNSQLPIHTFSEPGLYNVVATVENPTGKRLCQLQHSVYREPTAVRPNHSTTITFDQSTNRVWSVNPDNDTVTAIDATTLTKLVETPVGDNPRTIAVSPDGKIWVVNEGDASISILNALSGLVEDTVQLPSATRPYGVVFNSVTNDAYISLQATGEIVRLDTTSHAIAARQHVAPTVRGLSISADNQTLYLSRFISPQSHGELYILEAATLNTLDILQLANDPGPDTPESGRGVPNGLGTPTITPDGLRLLIPSKKDNTARGKALDGQSHTFESTVRSIVSSVDLSNNTETLSLRHDLNNSDMATAIAFNPRGDLYFVTTQGTHTVDVFHRYSNERLIAIENVGHSPQGLTVSPDGKQLFVQSFMSRTVEVYDISAISNYSNNIATHLASISTVANETLSPLLFSGKQLFYEADDPAINQDTYLACATCHMDERDDGRVWERSGFGEGLRNTISLIGRGGSDHGRIHWSANFDEIQDFEHDMREQFGGNGFLTDSQFENGTVAHPLGDTKAGLSPELDALSAYVNSLTEFPDSPYREANGDLTATAVAGKALFSTAGCADCHYGNGFTDAMMHDVGTLTTLSGERLGLLLHGIETPTLRGLWETPPYLHDGSAETLSDLLDRHNNGHTFTPTQKSDIVAYLSQIDDREPAPQPIPSPITLMPSANSISVNQALTITASITDTISPIISVTYYANDEILAEISAAPYSFVWQPQLVGNYLINGVATHANGYTSVAREETYLVVTDP